MAGSWVVGWNAGDVVTAAELRKSMGAIYDTTLSGAAASVDITSIVATYAHLNLVYVARSDNAGANIAVQLRFNNDSSAIYDDVKIAGVSGAIVGSEDVAATSMRVGTCAGTAGPVASSPGSGEVLIAGYAGTTFNKTASGVTISNQNAGAGGEIVYALGGHWRSTAAINRITLFPAAGNFIAGSRFTLYAMGA